jgi:hypothetical protein
MRTVWLAVFLLLVLTHAATAKEPTPKDFAYGMRLEVAGMDALYETPLPLDAYRGMLSGRLEDLCVFNGLGEIVPFTVRRPPPEVSAAGETKNLPLFLLSGDPERNLAGLSLQVRKDRTGSIVQVTTDGAVSTRKIVAYLLDASLLDRPVSALEVELQPMAEGSVIKVSVETSNDLEQWTTVLSGATIIRLRYGDRSLERRTIELEPVKAKYFRLSSPDSLGMPQLKGVIAHLAAPTIEAPRQWITVPAAVKTENPDEYSFDTAGHMPVDRLRIILPQDNTLVNATFYSRPAGDRPWIARQASLLYRLRIKGIDVTGPDIVLPPVTDRYWLMRVAPSGGGLGRGIPRLRFGWIPEKLVFVARGKTPFTLAYGSAQVRLDGRQGEALLTGFTELQGDRAATRVATTGPQMILGGAAVLRPGLTPQNWKTAVLWIALGLGVALLAWMATRLYKQLDKSAD